MTRSLRRLVAALLPLALLPSYDACLGRRQRARHRARAGRAGSHADKVEVFAGELSAAADYGDDAAADSTDFDRAMADRENAAPPYG